MGTRSFAQVAPTSATIALNAYIFGYGGHSLVTPHAALKQLWWTDERIEAKITRSFVVSKLRGEEREFLDRPLAFGEGLTDDTYMEWILERAKRLFLILTEVGVPDQIFGCIDDSWDDDDLPIPLESVRSLELTVENDEALNKNFYDMQFLYLLRELKQGSHIDYGPKEHIPMEYVNTVPPAVKLQIWDRIHFPGRPDDIHMRRKYSLTDQETGQDLKGGFMRDIHKAQALVHEHVASPWASYTSEDAAYIVSDFVGEHTLNTFIDHRMPAQFQRVSAPERPVLLCEWMHCLADALASLHHRGAAHTAIRPSNIVIDRTNRIAFADVGSIRTFQRGKKVNKNEVYDYAAPESQISQSPQLTASSPPVSSMGAFSKLRKMSSGSSSSSTASSASSSTRTNSFCTAATSPSSPSPTGRTNSMTTITTLTSPIHKSSGSFRNFSRHLHKRSFSTAREVPPSPTQTTDIHILPKPNCPNPDQLTDLPKASSELSDIYSLACVFLDILTFMIKGKTNDFVKFRTTRLSSSSPNSKRTQNDTSFHSSPERIEAWMKLLEEDSARHGEQVFRGVPGFTTLIAKMMSHTPTARPSALEVRDRIQEILVGECGIEALCCANRDWDVHVVSPEDSATQTTKSFHSRGHSNSVITASPSRTASECLRSASRLDDCTSVLTRTESNAVSARSRRCSSTSVTGAKIGSWRKAFARSR